MIRGIGGDAVTTGWRNRIVGYGEEAPDQLLANPSNWRVHPQHQQDALAGVLDEVGWVDDVIVNRTTGFVVDGHLRVAMAISKGVPTVPVKYVELTEAEEAKILATFDPVAAMAVADAEILGDLLQQVETESEAVRQLLEEVAAEAGVVLDEPPEDPGPQVDRAAELAEKWGTATGQVWELGEHRLAVGDCTDRAVVDAVMRGERASGAFTSPPYAEQRKRQYGGIPAADYVEWWGGVQERVREILAEDGSFFVNIKPHTERGERVLYVMELVIAMKRRWRWKFIDELVWYKTGFPGGYKNRFMNEFESVFWFALPGGGVNVFFEVIDLEEWDTPLVDQAESVFHFAKAARIKFHPRACGHPSNGVNRYVGGLSYNPLSQNIDFAENRRRGWARPGNVLKIHVNTERLAQAAVFPVGLPHFFIKSFSDQRDVWLDPFAGSGTTGIACERLDRKARLIEIDPGYCAVAIERWHEMTGRGPGLLQT